MSVLAGVCFEIQDVIPGLFEIDPPTEGSITVSFDPSGHAYARLEANGMPTSTLELVSSASELVSSANNARALYVDGLEQSADPSRGSTWNLHVREIGGAAGKITLRMFEAGNRSNPIAVQSFQVEPLGQLNLESVFAAMGLEDRNHLKDRTNVLLVLTPDSGSPVIAAVATEIDNTSGQVAAYNLEPASGLPSSGVTTSLVKVVEPEPERERKRPVRRD